jgi:hypothetical protein
MEIRNSKSTGEKGLFTLKKHKKGDVVYTLSGDIYDKPTRETIHIGNERHIYDEYGIYINHSFTPNVYVDNYDLIAVHDIEIDDEIFFNYNDTEINMANPFYVNNILVSGSKTRI